MLLSVECQLHRPSEALECQLQHERYGGNKAPHSVRSIMEARRQGKHTRWTGDGTK